MSGTTGGVPMFVCGPTTGCGKLTPMERIASGWVTPRNCVHCGREWRRLPGQEITLTGDLLYAPAAPRREDATEPKTIDLMKVLTDSLKSPRREDAAGERLAQIAARLKAATPGPWQRDRNWYVTAEGHDWDKCWLSTGITLDNYEPQHDRRICHVHGPATRGHDAAADFEFIAHSRSDMEYLLAALSTAERERSVPAVPSAEQLAAKFHETYELLAPRHGYETREASAKPWSEVPEPNKSLMIAVADEVLIWLSLRVPSGGEEGR